MAQLVPSRAALRALSRLCNGKTTPVRHRRPSLSTYCLQRSSTPAIQQRHKTTLRDNPEPQTFANDPTHYDPQSRTGPEPPNRGTVDPQKDASGPLLPDITNYYTLFPQTLPRGPPRASSATPGADSHTILEGQDSTSPQFYINPRELRKEFLHLQSQHHPDKFPQGSAAHQRAYALSTLLNNAYKTLSDPLARAQYLLELLYGIDVMDEDNSAHATDQETLMEVMEAQEELEGASGDEGREVVERLLEENRSRIYGTEKELERVFWEGDREGCRLATVRLKYWRSLESGLRDWEPGKEVRLTH